MTTHSTAPIWAITLSLMFTILLTGCSMTNMSEDTISSGVPAKELLLDTELLPADWTFNPCGDNCERIEGESYAERSFFLPSAPGLVLLEVSRFAEPEASKRTYKTYFEMEFRERAPPNRQFVPPSTTLFQSTSADEYYFGCGVDEVPGCRAIFRYGNYFVHLYSSWDNGNGEGLKLQEILQLLQALDKQVTTRLR